MNVKDLLQDAPSNHLEQRQRAQAQAQAQAHAQHAHTATGNAAQRDHARDRDREREREREKSGSAGNSAWGTPLSTADGPAHHHSARSSPVLYPQHPSHTHAPPPVQSSGGWPPPPPSSGKPLSGVSSRKVDNMPSSSSSAASSSRHFPGHHPHPSTGPQQQRSHREREPPQYGYGMSDQSPMYQPPPPPPQQQQPPSLSPHQSHRSPAHHAQSTWHGPLGNQPPPERYSEAPGPGLRELDRDREREREREREMDWREKEWAFANRGRELEPRLPHPHPSKQDVDDMDYIRHVAASSSRRQAAQLPPPPPPPQPSSKSSTKSPPKSQAEMLVLHPKDREREREREQLARERIHQREREYIQREREREREVERDEPPFTTRVIYSAEGPEESLVRSWPRDAHHHHRPTAHVPPPNNATHHHHHVVHHHHGGPPVAHPAQYQSSFHTGFVSTNPPPAQPAPASPPVAPPASLFETAANGRSRAGEHTVHTVKRVSKRDDFVPTHGSTIYSQPQFPQEEPLGFEEMHEDVPAPEAKVVISLGTFVAPKTPFPYFFDLVPPASTAPEKAEDEKAAENMVDEETRATLIIPSKFFTIALNGKPKIWGGGGPPSKSSKRPRRRVYTDDSDPVLCAIHSGYISKIEVQEAMRKPDLGLKVEVRVLRCLGSDYGVYVHSNVQGTGGKIVKAEVIGRFLGGFGDRLRAKLDEELTPERSGDDGRSIESCGWGGGHDGSAIEVIKAEVVKIPRDSHSRRSQRLLEYNTTRSAVLGKRKWAAGPHPPPSWKSANAAVLDVIVEEDENIQPDLVTVQVGTRNGVWFKFVPSDLNDAIHGETEAETRPRKRRRIGSDGKASLSQKRSIEFTSGSGTYRLWASSPTALNVSQVRKLEGDKEELLPHRTGDVLWMDVEKPDLHVGLTGLETGGSTIKIDNWRFYDEL